MKLLNSKSIIDCTEAEEEMHNTEISTILENLLNYPNYDCAVLVKQLDKAHKNEKTVVNHCKLYNCAETIEMVDSKNGVDIVLSDDYLTFIVYGQTYTMDNEYHLLKTGIQIRPYNEEKNFIKLRIS